jgi:hypothetical protein
VTVVCCFSVLVVGWCLRGLYLWLLLLHLIFVMFRSPGQEDMDMMEGRSHNKCGRYVVSSVARRWTALDECRIVLSVRSLCLSWLVDCCLYREAVGLLLGRRRFVTSECKGLVGVLSSWLLQFLKGRAGCRDRVPLCAGKYGAGWGW